SELGLFALAISLLNIAYESVFPSVISPLVESLQSNWLFIHVIIALIPQGILAVCFVVGLIYLIRQVNQTERTKKTTWLELILFSLVIALGFVVITTSFNAADYSAVFEIEENGNITEKDYHLTPIAGPAGGTLV